MNKIWLIYYKDQFIRGSHNLFYTWLALGKTKEDAIDKIALQRNEKAVLFDAMQKEVII